MDAEAIERITLPGHKVEISIAYIYMGAGIEEQLIDRLNPFIELRAVLVMYPEAI
jgi:hypothetical protein